jgi:hypothetical protein
MARRKKISDVSDNTRNDDIPPGATRAASDHDLRPGEPPDRTPSGEEAVGTPGGGTEVGGLGGTNIDDGDFTNANLEQALRSNPHADDDEDGGPPYAGHAGGAVGGTLADSRARGGHVRHGIAPGGVTHGDSTIGHDPMRRQR